MDGHHRQQRLRQNNAREHSRRDHCARSRFGSAETLSAYCQQDSTQPPANLADFALDWSHEAIETRTLLALEDDWLWRYDTLSGGQQKRIQIACALFMRPDVLIMDEPTNDLDAETKTLVAHALASFKGIGILISHDRSLLDSLAMQSLLFEDGRWVSRPGGYSKARSQAENERATALEIKENATREAKRLKKEAQRRREEAARQQSKRSKAGLAKGDSDGREKSGGPSTPARTESPGNSRPSWKAA